MNETILLKTRWGQMFALANDLYITKSLQELREYGKEESELFLTLIRPGMGVVDAGANIGAFSLLMAKACSPGRLFAFEPQQKVFQLLCANFAINRIENALAFPEGLAETESWMALPRVRYDMPGNFGALALQSEGDPVRITTLDVFNIQNCGLIKIDVEGGEAKALIGMKETIFRTRPVLYVENDRFGKQQELIDLIDSFGYDQYWHATPLGDIFPGIGSINMLCVPKESKTIRVEGFDRIDPKDWTCPVELVQ